MMTLIIDCTGTVHCLYDEAINLASLGRLTIKRASHVEPDEDGSWWADLSPALGPRLGPFPTRTAAILAEATWLLRNRLGV